MSFAFFAVKTPNFTAETLSTPSPDKIELGPGAQVLEALDQEVKQVSAYALSLR